MFRRSNDIVTGSFKLCRQRTTDATRSVCMLSIKATNAFVALILGLVVCLLIATGCQPAGSERSDRSELSSGSERHAAGKAAASQPLGANVPPLGANVQPSGDTVQSPILPDAESAMDQSGGTDERIDGLSVEAASRFIELGKLDEASSVLTKLLVMRPDDVRVLFLSARLAAQQSDLSRAVVLLGEIPEDHPEAGLPALGQAAEWCFMLERYDDAEINYRKLLNASPNFVPAIRQLAFLLNRQGRRQEASVLIRQLCKLGDVLQDELHSLVALRDAMYHDPDEVANQSRDGTVRYYFPIGPYGKARHAFQANDFERVLELLRPTMEQSKAPTAMVALFGRAACEQQNDQAVAWWKTFAVEGQDEFADYWATLGTLALQSQHYGAAARALAEALQRDGTDMESMSRMRQALASLGKPAEAELWFHRWTEARAVLDANNVVAATITPDSTAVGNLADALEQVDRKIEALMWRALSSSPESAGPSLAELKQQHQQLVQSQQGFPDQASLWCGLDFLAFPLPEASPVNEAKSVVRPFGSSTVDSPVISPAFRNIADAAGLKHIYRVAAQPLPRHYSIHQTLGGGVAVLDYDLDGWPDLYFAQGGSGAPSFVGALPNQLYRNQATTLADVSDFCDVSVREYSIGVSKGDWNQDGFPDLVIANIGTCLLLTNNGDGTFSQRSLERQPNYERIPASICIADVTADGLPDIVQVGYVDDSNVFAKPPLDDQGNVTITVAPGSFGGAIDCLFANNGVGGFAYHGLTDLSDARTGLGLVVADFDDQLGNELFIGNDSLPNRLWKLETTNQNGLQKLDLASVLGCAYGFSGGATGAMGIAVGDFDQNMKMDFHVTNFENESSNLYLKHGAAFQDRNRQFDVAAISTDLVGFGTQAFDYDNDRDTDLVIANGHLDNAVSIRGEFPQRLQLLCNRGRRFQLLEVSDPTNYWGQSHVGRSLAMLDFNRDGLNDIVMTNVEEPSALLLNQTEVANHWLQVELVGTSSDRDAVGAEVVLVGSEMTQHAWRVAGDGYLCSNEDMVAFGLGDDDVIERLEVFWPDGTRQEITGIAADQRVIVIQDQSEVSGQR
ncbi:MAG: FG-GAP-like repeat-containing protein [Rubripirellula sp.]